jgi:hypothetical protein
MLDFKVVSLYNNLNQVYIDIFQQPKREFKIRTQISLNTYNYEYVWGLYELSRSVSFHIIYGYEMVYNNLGYDFAYAVHAGNFKAFEPPDEPPDELPPIEEHTELPPIEEHNEERAEEHTEEPFIEEHTEEPFIEEHTEERAEEQIEENIVLEQPLLTRSCSIYY